MDSFPPPIFRLPRRDSFQDPLDSRSFHLPGILNATPNKPIILPCRTVDLQNLSIDCGRTSLLQGGYFRRQRPRSSLPKNQVFRGATCPHAFHIIWTCCSRTHICSNVLPARRVGLLRAHEFFELWHDISPTLESMLAISSMMTGERIS